jgi:REP element-mobilizing transposase RayT
MARPLRIEFPGAFYHVCSRGIARDPIFRTDQHRQLFLGILGKVVERYHIKIHSYCLMGNHYHLLIETPEGNLSLAMRQLQAVYGASYNRLLKRPGPVFQGRFKASVVDENTYGLAVCRYIVRNPVRAKMVKRPGQWRWSSYRALAGIAGGPPWLTTATVLALIGGRTAEEAQRRYSEFIAEEGEETDRDMHHMLEKVIVGAEAFRQRLSERLRATRSVKEVPRAQRYEGRPALSELFEGSMTKKGRDRRIVEAHSAHGYTQKAIADHLDMHYATISRIVKNEE